MNNFTSNISSSSSGVSTTPPTTTTVLEFSVWVTNIDNRVTVDEILKLFNYCGPVKSIIFKKLNPEHKDALIIFSDIVSLDTSLLLDQAMLSSKAIRVSKDIPKEMIDINVIHKLAQQPLSPHSPSPSSSSSSSPPHFSSQPNKQHKNGDLHEQEDNQMMEEIVASGITMAQVKDIDEKFKVSDRLKQFVKNSLSSSSPSSPIVNTNRVPLD
ncbi:hypothetical protein DFA_01993 [Cavenderia fasciculata]|uniref:RRM domain-containing protein n=1 Tax=Cavenderia fasciculata TaxID=261658 RepID=F4PR46_CACFS|nr:uncharacterized protein DFA_01993 [Cavenderia fasciculata]EGG22103.1 hypothetical protein DFA_01993 [Cavenderia fasciculata]|eukprot:XP_004359954.1 hypothetical protein DFA_01993 [Cavenderia fasciculata]